MHSLHKILVRLHGGNVPVAYFEDDRAVKIGAARSFAESETDCFADDAFDWRETATAGRWKAIYPENVLLSCEDFDRFIKELDACRGAQDAEIDSQLKYLKDAGVSDLDSLVSKLREGTKLDNDIEFDLAPYRLRCLTRLLYGEYFYDSFFYDTERYTARINSSTIEAVKQSPDDWALVLFDQHF